MVATGSPLISPTRKPSGSTTAKQAASASPGFQPSAAAQSTAMAMSSGCIGRIRRSPMVDHLVDHLADHRVHGFVIGLYVRTGSAQTCPRGAPRQSGKNMAAEKVALITAGGSGMGAGAARRLAADGFQVAILSSSGKGEALAVELGGLGVTGSNRSNDDLKRL